MRRNIINQHFVDGRQWVMTLTIQRQRSWRADVWAVKSYFGDIGGGDMLWVGVIDSTQDDVFQQCEELVKKKLDKIPAFSVKEKSE